MAAGRAVQPGILLLGVLSCVGLYSCERMNEFQLFKRPQSKAEKPSEEQQLAQKTQPLPGTVGAACGIEGMRMMLVEGYGLVVDLGGRGSSECPEPLRQELVEAIARNQRRYTVDGKRESESPAALIASRDTAVVRIAGQIPAGALKGERFDLSVEALPNTGTTSLEGGWLYPCDLRAYAGAGSRSMKTRILARAEGATFINPFEKEEPEKRAVLRRQGYVLGGGINLEDRRLSLRLNQPSYGLARSMEQKINSLFTPPPDDPLRRTAQAVSPSKIELHIPPEYRDRKEYFLALLRSLYIRSDPNFLERQARDLRREILSPLTNVEAISFAWETMGKTVLPMIQELYRSSNVQAAFYSARAGAALGDDLAVDRLQGFALGNGAYPRKAIEQLGFCRSVSAQRALRKVIEESDLDQRIRAYEALARTGDVSVRREDVGHGNFRLDVVASKSWPVVYVSRSKEPRIVLFGQITVEPPVFYTHWDESIMISADRDDKELSLVRKLPSGRITGRVAGPLDLAALLKLSGEDLAARDGKFTALGLPYSHVVSILHALCADGSIPARFQLEQRSILPDQWDASLGRPEREE